MKNNNWRRAAIILGIVIVGLICFGAGYASGAYDTAKNIIEIGIEVLGIEAEVSMVELFHQYQKMKGGML